MERAGGDACAEVDRGGRTAAHVVPVAKAHKAWLKSPEVLENCSTGLHFPSEHLENSEVASTSKARCSC